jgi:hypothetical protein
MSVILNEPGIAAFFNGPQMERIMQPRAEAVLRQAETNAGFTSPASPPNLGIDGGDLTAELRFSLRPGPDGMEAVIGTDANKDGFSYPAYWDLNGRPWLFSALQSVFPETARR